ncbi:phage major capsid protein [Glycomyces lechevalierae]|uniref:Phage capsid-like C-terminal domain-containing protein n=1 Tax=Glycomyces lechevalierae TaxID=256034 RepID=A0ABU2AHZ2_9ACTN|nr:phage major capsid protein [Glycomyces lechevalierae]MDR7336831.1 hypothetical protein [Glycomyces lechevalierae]
MPTETDERERLIEFPALKEARGELDARRKSLRDILAEAGPDYDMTKIKSVTGDNAAKVKAIQDLNEEINERKQKVDELLVVARAAAEAKYAEDEPEHKGLSEDGDGSGRGPERKDGGNKSLGELFMGSQAFKGYGRGSGQGPQAHLDLDVGKILKADFLTSAGWAPESVRTGRVESFPTRPAPRVVDFLPQTTTTQAAVVYMEETTFTNTAAETAEAGSYPEAALALTERTVAVRKIAVYLPVSDEQFEDEPRAQQYVNNRLPFMLRQRLDLQILVGDGSAPNLLGTENVSGIQTQALGTDSTTDAIYKAMRRIRDDGFAEPSVVFIRPSAWESVRLMKTADGMYIWGHPSIPGPTTVWGVPVVETTAVTATKAIIGDYTNFSELAVRRGIDIQVSNSHSDFFVKGKLAIRADMRAALIHYRPKAFAVVTGL